MPRQETFHEIDSMSEIAGLYKTDEEITLDGYMEIINEKASFAKRMYGYKRVVIKLIENYEGCSCSPQYRLSLVGVKDETDEQMKLREACEVWNKR